MHERIIHIVPFGQRDATSQLIVVEAENAIDY
jgi:hypothetical protein